MRTVFFGTPAFAADTLSYLLENGVEIAAVVSKPDKPKGRSLKLMPTPVKLEAEARGIPVYQPEKASDPAFAEILKKYDPDLFVVVAYGEIIKEHLLQMPRLGCINLHTSLLPKYRGAAPVQRAVMAGEPKTGVSVIYMVKKMDAGDVIKTVETPIGPNETFGEVEERLKSLGSKALLDTVRLFDRGRPPAMPQDEAAVTFAPKVELEDCEIDWNMPAETIHNLVRGTNPYPAAWCYVSLHGEKKRFKIYRTEAAEELEGSAGRILETPAKGVYVGCGKGALKLLEVQLEGKKAMAAEDLMRGIPSGTLSII